MFFGSKKRRIYLDYASATPVLKEAREAYLAALECFGNPSSIHKEGVEADALLERSREGIARDLGAKARDVLFVSGGSEGNALAILGAAKRLEERAAPGEVHFVTSAIEHPSVSACFGELERRGARVSYLAPDARGLIAPEHVAEALRPETRFVSIGWANGEIGVVQPLGKIAQAIRAHEAMHDSRIFFHTDAGQAPLYRFPHVHTLGVDLMTLDAGKCYAPRGCGVLYSADGVSLAPLIMGGGQERGMRAGTEHVAGAAAFAAALEVVAREREAEAKRLANMRDALARELAASIPGLVVNGDLKHALPHILNVSIPGVSSEYLALALDAEGVAVSTKSACKEGEADTSHVVAALVAGRPDDAWRAAHTIRFSLGRETSDEDVRRASETCIRVLSKLRDGGRGTSS